MESIIVKEMMVLLADYATVSEEATLYEAVRALEDAQDKFNQDHYRHRAVLVYDARGKIVGKLSQLDVIRALEPKYQDVGDFKELDGYGINADYIRSLIKELGLLKRPLGEICRKAAAVKVKNIMYTPAEGEFVDEGATLNEAVVQFLVGKHQSLLVTRGKEIVGILRLTDVFKKVCDMISSCKI
ncbi:MAG: CBS domain-containing protein [Desulfobacterales bacterium]|nr:CBS domain-containing protein [Desulfobacterales bacterium]